MRRHLSLLASIFLFLSTIGAVLVLVPRTVEAAIAVDNTTTDVDSVGRSSASFSHTVSGTNRLLLVFIHAADTTGDNANAVSYGGQSLIEGAEWTETNSGYRTAEIWYLANPATGSNTVSVTYSGTLNNDCIGAVSLTGVHPNDPIGATGTDDGALSILSVDVTTEAANSWVVAGGLIRGDDSDPFSPGVGDSEIYDTSSGGGSTTTDSGCTADYTATASAGSYTVSASASTADDWAMVGLEVKAASAGGIGFDAATSASDNTAITQLSWSHTTAGSNRVLVVGCAVRNDDSQSLASVDYENTPLTFLRADTNGQSARSELWYLVAPAIGAHTVRVNLSGSSTKMACGAITLTGVDQSTPVDAHNGATGSSTAPNATVTTVNDDAWIIDVAAFRSTGNGLPTGTPGAAQAERWSEYTESGGEAPNIRGKGSTEGPQSPPGGVVMDWSLGASVDWAISAASFRPLSTGSCDALTVTTSDAAGQLWFNETVESDGVPYTTQVNVSASGQTGATPALRVTNDGGIACDVTIRLMSDPGTGRSLKFNTSNSAPWPGDASREVPLDPSSVTVCNSVASAETCDIWLWADYENALGGQAVVDVRVETL